MKNIFKILICILFLMVVQVYAQEYPEGTEFVLTYPDGSKETVTSYEQAQDLLNGWKLLYSGTTNESGNIVLENWSNEGSIKIVETKVPEGYTANSTTTEANLSDKRVTIINNRNEQTPDKKEKTTKENNKKDTKVVSEKKDNPKTNIASNPSTYILIVGMIIFTISVIANINVYLKNKKSS